MKNIALLAAAGSLAAFAAPAQAAELPVSAAPGLTTIQIDATDFAPVAAYDDWDDDDDWRDRRRWRGRDRDWDRGRHRDWDDERRYRGEYWRGRDGRLRCRRNDGTTGLLVGAGVGALLGRTIDTRGDRTVGTLLGGALGAVLGREIDRGGDVRCR
jgi:hypothetical protein